MELENTADKCAKCGDKQHSGPCQTWNFNGRSAELTRPA